MFDEFKQDTNERDIDTFSSPLPLNKKIALAIAALAMLGFFVWYSGDSTPPQPASLTTTSEEYSSLRSRVEALEKTVFNAQSPFDQQLARSHTEDTRPAPSFLPSDDLFLPNEQKKLQSTHTEIPVSEPSSTPKEIAIDLSSLFEKEIALSGQSQRALPAPSTEQNTTSTPSSYKQGKGKLKEVPPSGTVYTVQKGDTLSKISQKFYGTPNKWKKIVEANKEKLGNNQVLKSGMSIRIPEE